MGKKTASGSGISNLDHISESLEKMFFGLKSLNSLMRIRDGKTSDPGSGINIPDPQHWHCVDRNFVKYFFFSFLARMTPIRMCPRTRSQPKCI
jgi:hypothetical protein